jgi:two-component system, cell cycle sensor histidine kinase and response regulator CckA
MAAEGSNSQTIMVVEDESVVLELITNILKTNGYEVVTARNGAEALLVAGSREGNIDLVLTDIVMPGMSGGEMVQQLLEMQPGIRVLYMSGYTKYTILGQGTLESVNSFIWKPFSPADLLSKIRVLLETPAN